MSLHFMDEGPTLIVMTSFKLDYLLTGPNSKCSPHCEFWLQHKNLGVETYLYGIVYVFLTKLFAFFIFLQVIFLPLKSQTPSSFSLTQDGI